MDGPRSSKEVDVDTTITAEDRNTVGKIVEEETIVAKPEKVLEDDKTEDRTPERQENEETGPMERMPASVIKSHRSNVAIKHDYVEEDLKAQPEEKIDNSQNAKVEDLDGESKDTNSFRERQFGTKLDMINATENCDGGDESVKKEVESNCDESEEGSADENEQQEQQQEAVASRQNDCEGWTSTAGSNNVMGGNTISNSLLYKRNGLTERLATQSIITDDTSSDLSSGIPTDIIFVIDPDDNSSSNTPHVHHHKYKSYLIAWLQIGLCFVGIFVFVTVLVYIQGRHDRHFGNWDA